MKKQFIIGFVSGAVLFGAIGALAGNYMATDNPFPVKLNGNDVSIQGYNINDNTYFKLRDIADVVGGFDVVFYNGSIHLATEEGFLDNLLPHYTNLPPEAAKHEVVAVSGFEDAELLSEDDNYYYFAPCDSDMVGSMKSSGGHISPATIVYKVDKSTGLAERVQ